MTKGYNCAMPRVATLTGNIAVYMYGDDHPPPHVHVYAGEQEASMALDGTIVVGALDKATRKMSRVWVVANASCLAKYWKELGNK